MSTVQLAFDTRLERYVAVKLLAEHLAADDGFVARFRREALAAARLVHPNVVQVYDFGTDEAQPAPVHRRWSTSRATRARSCCASQGRLTPEEVVDICAQACRGLDYAHRNGVIHRDIKPGNILRNPEHVVKIADFGIAKAADDSDITRVGSVIGTAAYLSPEQARGEPAGPPSDLYALGVVAYQLITGRLPYQGASLTDLARQQESGPPTDVHDVVPDVPAGARRPRSCARSPATRPRATRAAPEMERALRDGLRGIAPRRPARSRRRHDATRRARTRRTRRARCRRSRARARTSRCSRSPSRPSPAARPPARRAGRRAAPPKRRNVVPFVLMALIVAALIVGGASTCRTPATAVQTTTTFDGGLQRRRSTTSAARSATTRS